MTEGIRFRLVGGHPAVDFVNTLGGSLEEPIEIVHSYADLIGWAEQAGLLAYDDAGELRQTGQADSPRAADVLEDARRLRANLDAALRSLLTAQDPPVNALEEVRDAYLDGLSHAHLDLHRPRYEWAWKPESTADPRTILWPIAHQAVDLLRSDELTRLHACSGCRWIFLDYTKNRSRQWCSADSCGATARMRRYRARRR